MPVEQEMRDSDKAKLERATARRDAAHARQPTRWKDAYKGDWFYRLTCFMFRLIGKVWLRQEIVGLDNVPKSGPVLILPTHTSFADPPMVGSNILRECHYLSREGILKAPIIGPTCQYRLNAHPIRRGGSDREAIRICRSLLKQGCSLLFFPEGTRSKDGRLGPIQGGFAMILEGIDAPYVPVVAQSTFRILPREAWFLRPRKMRIVYGKPTHLTERIEGEPTREYFKRCAEKIEREYRELGAQ